MEEEIVGFRFRPTGYEFVNHYLKRKLQKIDENHCVIPDINIYDYNPRELCAVYNERSCKGSTSSDSFFFCPRNRLNPKVARFKRQARGGYWKETGKKRDIEDEEGKTIGTKRILVFYSGKQGNAQVTDWAMHEYHLNEDVADGTITDPMAIAICHVKKKTRSKKGNLKEQQSMRVNSKKQRSKTSNPKKQHCNKSNLKKQKSKAASSPSYEADLSSPEGKESLEKSYQVEEIWMHQPSLLQEPSPVAEEDNIPTGPEGASPSVGVFSPEQLQMVDQSAVFTHGSSQEHGYACNITQEQSYANVQSALKNLGMQETSLESSFNGQLAVEFRSPQKESSIFGWLDYSAEQTWHSEGNTVLDDSCEDGVRLSVMDFCRDDELAQKEISDVLSTKSSPAV